MHAPRFSVIIPTLNEEKFLPNLLESLTHQSRKNFEVIVVDGKSRDKTIGVAERFKQKIPLRIVLADHASLPFQRNVGAGQALGEWFVFVDADSVLLPYFIERIDSFIRQDHPQVFTTWVRPDSEVSGDALVTLLGNMMLEGSILFRRPLAPGPMTVVTREAFFSVNGFNETLSFGEDHDFSRRLYEHGVQLHLLRETLYIWSLRRFRRQGTLRVIQTYAKAIFSVLLTKRPPKHIPGYIMGGHLYGRTKKSKSVLVRYEKRFKRMIKELFE